MDKRMKATDQLQIILPDDIDIESRSNEIREQTVRSLSVDFRESVKSKVSSGKPLEQVIQDLSVKDINDIFFNDTVPNASGKCYYSIIEEFLSAPHFYKDALYPITDGYLSIVSLLQEQIQKLLVGGKTTESDANYKTSTATYLDARLTSICERTKLFISIQKEYDEIEELNRAQVTQLEGTLSDLTKVVYDEKDDAGRTIKPGIRTTVRDLSDKVEDIKSKSDQIMPNIISLLGVFSSVILVILSAISTTSTWLSNANETSVLIAFVVPSGIITLAICALTALVRSLLGGQVNQTGSSQNEKSHPIQAFFQKWGVWLIISTAAVLSICVTMQFCQRKSDSETHYIVKCLPTTDTTLVSNDASAQSTPDISNQELFIIQKIILPTGETQEEWLPCDESDKHADGFVYYCLLHQRFE